MQYKWKYIFLSGVKKHFSGNILQTFNFLHIYKTSNKKKAWNMSRQVSGQVANKPPDKTNVCEEKVKVKLLSKLLSHTIIHQFEYPLQADLLYLL